MCLTFCPRREDVSEVDGPEGGVVLADGGRPLLPELGTRGQPQRRKAYRRHAAAKLSLKKMEMIISKLLLKLDL